MEFKGASYLYTLASLMVTFAGFSALLLAIRQSAGARLSSLDRFLAETTVGHATMLTGGGAPATTFNSFRYPRGVDLEGICADIRTPNASPVTYVP